MTLNIVSTQIKWAPYLDLSKSDKFFNNKKWYNFNSNIANDICCFFNT